LHLGWIGALLALGACDRSERSMAVNSAANGAADSAGAGGTASGGSGGDGGSAGSPLGCVEPTPAEPPPTQEPATDCPVDPDVAPQLEHVFITFADAPGAPRIEAEHAQTTSERNRGLMYRTEMPRDAGMLFSWPDERVRSFWMHNTCIPLDMLFIDADGGIAGILEQVPVLNEASRSVPCPAKYVLEMNAGWTRANGVVAGQHVLIDD
jgi:uncharacterized membrane protein (UPF0127 family)